MLPVGSGYFTCIQNMKLVTAEFKSGGLREKHVQNTQDNYNNTHKKTTTIHIRKLTTIHTRQLQQNTQENYNNTHKTTTTIHTRQLQKTHKTS